MRCIMRGWFCNTLLVLILELTGPLYVRPFTYIVAFRALMSPPHLFARLRITTCIVISTLLFVRLSRCRMPFRHSADWTHIQFHAPCFRLVPAVHPRTNRKYLLTTVGTSGRLRMGIKKEKPSWLVQNGLSRLKGRLPTLPLSQYHRRCKV